MLYSLSITCRKHNIAHAPWPYQPQDVNSGVLGTSEIGLCGHPIFLQKENEIGKATSKSTWIIKAILILSFSNIIAFVLWKQIHYIQLGKQQ